MAWIDENGNGVLDPGEKPLAGVAFYVDDTLNKIEKVGRPAVSDAQGQAQLGVFLPGCPRAAFEVYADAPPNYQLTTPSRIAADSNSKGTVFQFGFKPLK